MSAAKRVFDLALTIPTLALLLPLLALLAVAVKLDSHGPVLYRQTRVGRGGRPFILWKFRTMVVDADRVGPLLTVAADPRVTRLGRWLRRWKLDELPQLVNVLVGDMSLVGPRPEVPRYVALYRDTEQEVIGLIPGITDPASIAYRNEEAVLARAPDPERTYIAEVMPHKIRLNLEYAQRATPYTDLIVVLRTIRALALGARESSRADAKPTQ
jgi:lipopolysaccharide/colanic/teichoic acid biosynthesis glycosyltransferase